MLYLTFGNMALKVTDVILRLLNRRYRDVSSNCFANVRMKSFLRSNPLFLVINNPPMSSTTFVFFVAVISGGLGGGYNAFGSKDGYLGGLDMVTVMGLGYVLILCSIVYVKICRI